MTGNTLHGIDYALHTFFLQNQLIRTNYMYVQHALNKWKYCKTAEIKIGFQISTVAKVFCLFLKLDNFMQN